MAGFAAAAASTPSYGAHPFTPKQKQVAISERQILKRARLGDLRPDGTRQYVAEGGMRVNAGVKRTRTIMTDFALYPKIVRFVTRAQFDPKESVLWLEGNVLRYHLSSWIHFNLKGDPNQPNKIHFRFVAGHFQGMEGDLEFEDIGEQGTWVAARAEFLGRSFAPRLVIENGAQFVFGYTAGRMRTFIEREFKNYEEEKTRALEKKGGSEEKIPRPQKTFPRKTSF